MKDDQEFNIWFVREMRKHPCLYNHADCHYNMRTSQEKSWKAIADAASCHVNDCKEKWKNIRASFTRHLKHKILELKNKDKARKPYYLAEHLDYLLPFTKVRSFPEDNLKYYSDLIDKISTAPENVVYIDSDDTNLSDEFRPNDDDVDEIDALHEDNEHYSIDDQQNRELLNENANNTQSQQAENRHSIYALMVPTTCNPTNNMPHNASNSDTQQNTTVTVKEEISDTTYQNQPLKIKQRNANEDEDDFPAAKRRRNIEDDADLDFLKSLLPDIKTMNGSQKRKFKMNVLKLIDDILDSSVPGTSQSHV